MLTYPRQKYLVPKVQFLGVTEPNPVSMAVVALDATVCASLITLKAAVVILGASLCKDCTMLGGVRPRGDRLISQTEIYQQRLIQVEGEGYIYS